MDALVVERVCAEWAGTVDGLVFRGVCLEPATARIYMGPPRGSRGRVYALVARWAEPLWLCLEESGLPKERDRVPGTLRLDGVPVQNERQLAGVAPIKSLGAARYMATKVPGMEVDPEPLSGPRAFRETDGF